MIMSSHVNKNDRNRSKYSALDINSTFREKTIEQRNHPRHRAGLQVIGQITATRRVPQPAWVPSLQSENNFSSRDTDWRSSNVPPVNRDNSTGLQENSNGPSRNQKSTWGTCDTKWTISSPTNPEWRKDMRPVEQKNFPKLPENIKSDAQKSNDKFNASRFELKPPGVNWTERPKFSQIQTTDSKILIEERTSDSKMNEVTIVNTTANTQSSRLPFSQTGVIKKKELSATQVTSTSNITTETVKESNVGVDMKLLQFYSTGWAAMGNEDDTLTGQASSSHHEVSSSPLDSKKQDDPHVIDWDEKLTFSDEENLVVKFNSPVESEKKDISPIRDVPGDRTSSEQPHMNLHSTYPFISHCETQQQTVVLQAQPPPYIMGVPRVTHRLPMSNSSGQIRPIPQPSYYGLTGISSMNPYLLPHPPAQAEPRGIPPNDLKSAFTEEFQQAYGAVGPTDLDEYDEDITKSNNRPQNDHQEKYWTAVSRSQKHRAVNKAINEVDGGIAFNEAPGGPPTNFKQFPDQMKSKSQEHFFDLQFEQDFGSDAHAKRTGLHPTYDCPPTILKRPSISVETPEKLVISASEVKPETNVLLDRSGHKPLENEKRKPNQFSHQRPCLDDDSFNRRTSHRVTRGGRTDISSKPHRPADTKRSNKPAAFRAYCSEIVEDYNEEEFHGNLGSVWLDESMQARARQDDQWGKRTVYKEPQHALQYSKKKPADPIPKQLCAKPKCGSVPPSNKYLQSNASRSVEYSSTNELHSTNESLTCRVLSTGDRVVHPSNADFRVKKTGPVSLFTEKEQKELENDKLKHTAFVGGRGRVNYGYDTMRGHGRGRMRPPTAPSASDLVPNTCEGSDGRSGKSHYSGAAAAASSSRAGMRPKAYRGYPFASQRGGRGGSAWQVTSHETTGSNFGGRGRRGRSQAKPSFVSDKNKRNIQAEPLQSDCNEQEEWETASEGQSNGGGDGNPRKEPSDLEETGCNEKKGSSSATREPKENKSAGKFNDRNSHDGSSPPPPPPPAGASGSGGQGQTGSSRSRCSASQKNHTYSCSSRDKERDHANQQGSRKSIARRKQFTEVERGLSSANVLDNSKLRQDNNNNVNQLSVSAEEKAVVGELVKQADYSIFSNVVLAENMPQKTIDQLSSDGEHGEAFTEVVSKNVRRRQKIQEMKLKEEKDRLRKHHSLKSPQTKRTKVKSAVRRPLQKSVTVTTTEIFMKSKAVTATNKTSLNISEVAFGFNCQEQVRTDPIPVDQDCTVDHSWQRSRWERSTTEEKRLERANLPEQSLPKSTKMISKYSSVSGKSSRRPVSLMDAEIDVSLLPKNIESLVNQLKQYDFVSNASLKNGKQTYHQFGQSNLQTYSKSNRADVEEWKNDTSAELMGAYADATASGVCRYDQGDNSEFDKEVPDIKCNLGVTATCESHTKDSPRHSSRVPSSANVCRVIPQQQQQVSTTENSNQRSELFSLDSDLTSKINTYGSYSSGNNLRYFSTAQDFAASSTAPTNIFIDTSKEIVQSVDIAGNQLHLAPHPAQQLSEHVGWSGIGKTKRNSADIPSQFSELPYGLNDYNLPNSSAHFVTGIPRCSNSFLENVRGTMNGVHFGSTAADSSWAGLPSSRKDSKGIPQPVFSVSMISPSAALNQEQNIPNNALPAFYQQHAPNPTNPNVFTQHNSGPLSFHPGTLSVNHSASGQPPPAGLSHPMLGTAGPPIPSDSAFAHSLEQRDIREIGHRTLIDSRNNHPNRSYIHLPSHLTHGMLEGPNAFSSNLVEHFIHSQRQSANVIPPSGTGANPATGMTFPGHGSMKPNPLQTHVMENGIVARTMSGPAYDLWRSNSITDASHGAHALEVMPAGCKYPFTAPAFPNLSQAPANFRAPQRFANPPPSSGLNVDISTTLQLSQLQHGNLMSAHHAQPPRPYLFPSNSAQQHHPLDPSGNFVNFNKNSHPVAPNLLNDAFFTGDVRPRTPYDFNAGPNINFMPAGDQACFTRPPRHLNPGNLSFGPEICISGNMQQYSQEDISRIRNNLQQYVPYHDRQSSARNKFGGFNGGHPGSFANKYGGKAPIATGAVLSGSKAVGGRSVTSNCSKLMTAEVPDTLDAGKRKDSSHSSKASNSNNSLTGLCSSQLPGTLIADHIIEPRSAERTVLVNE